MFFPLFVGGEVILQKLWRRSISEIEDPGLTLFGVKEVMEDDGGERDMVEAENNNNPIEESKGIEG